MDDTPASLEIARALIRQRRWLDADCIIKQALQKSHGSLALRAECAQVQLCLGNPNAALQMLTPCIYQGITTPSINGMAWRAKVRSAQSSLQAAQLVREALSSGQSLPEHVIEEWRMIANGLLQAGWHHDAEPWLHALGSSAEDLKLTSLWLQESGPKAKTSKLNLDHLSALMVLHPAKELQRKAQAFNQEICQAWLEALPPRLALRPGPRRRWLLCANDNLPQCWLYRVEQKRQQLLQLGCQPTVLTLNKLHTVSSIPSLLGEIDGLLIHRLPASQLLFSLIAEARRQGIPVLFDLDDLLFDPEHCPPPLANYGGSVPPEWHRKVSATLPQLQASLRAADQLLFSTSTLHDRWAAIQHQQGHPAQPIEIWPNLIPTELLQAQRKPRLRWLRQRSGRLRLVVASASTPHTLVWHQQLAPALAQLMRQHPRLRLDLLGSLQLPLVLEPFQSRIRCRGHCPFPDYLRRLGEGDIGLMVLEPGPFTDAKSPNRWMECSLMGLATVLSPIRSCRELLRNGEHTLFANSQQAWVDQINQLIAQPQQRLDLARRAQHHALEHLGADQAATRWAPLLQRDHPRPQQRVALIVDADSPNAIQGEARLANALAQALRQPPKRRVDWRQHGWDTPADCLHITGTGAQAQAAVDRAIERQIPYVLHLHDGSWLKAEQQTRLQRAACCTASSHQLQQASRAAGLTNVTVIAWPWRAFPTQERPKQDGPLRALVPHHRGHESGLLALKAAIKQLPPQALEFTVLDDAPAPIQPRRQRWGGCDVHWCSALTRPDLAELLASHQVWIEPTLSGGDDLALAKEVLSAGLWLLASDASATAELLKNNRFGTRLHCQQRSDWPQQLLRLQGHDHPPAPLLQFPATQPNLTDVLESLHKRLGIWADQRKPVL